MVPVHQESQIRPDIFMTSRSNSAAIFDVNLDMPSSMLELVYLWGLAGPSTDAKTKQSAKKLIQNHS